MPEVSISKAIKLAGVSRQHFYDTYVHTGKITVNRSNPKKPLIDTSEILRVFGRLSEDRQPEDTKNLSPISVLDDSLKLDLERLKAENEGLRSLVNEKSSRITEKDLEIERQRERIISLEARYDRLLEDKASKSKPRSRWDRLKALFSLS